MQYIDFNSLTLEQTTTAEKPVVFLTTVSYNDAESISTQWSTIRAAVENVLADIKDTEVPHNLQFEVQGAEKFTPDSFVSAINLILTAVFEVLHGGESLVQRERERRLDVPEALKKVNCSMSLIKRAVNYKTRINKFQVEIYGDEFSYVLVGDEDDE